MLKLILYWYRLKLIEAFGPYRQSLQKLIITRLAEELRMQKYDMYTCIEVKRVFGKKALEWYQRELIQYTLLVYPGVRAYSVAPFAWISEHTGRTNEIERQLFIEYMLDKYN